MAECIENKALQLCGGGVNTSGNATFRLCGLKSNFMFLLRRIINKTLCHSELVSESQKCIEEKSNLPSYRANEVRCGIFKKVLKKIPQCVSLMRDDIGIRHTFKKALAFTLAETLIVMGIIGVVAALTIPNLNSSTGEKEKVAKVKKLYSNLNDAFERAQAVYGPLDEWFEGDTTQQAQSTRFAERMTEFMKVSKTCKFTAGCFSSGKLLNYDGIEYDSNYVQQLISDGTYMIITADGTSVGFISYAGEQSRIRIDIDGPNKGPNKIGTDIFDFSIDNINDEYQKNVLYPSGSPTQWTGNDVRNYETAWIVQMGNMDYLKATTTNGTYKCPNGKTLNWQNQTSCK